jgi:biopolymer transport protein ExbD
MYNRKIAPTVSKIKREIEEEKKLNQDLKVLIRPDKTASIEKYVEIVTFIQRNTSIQQVGMIGK